METSSSFFKCNSCQIQFPNSDSQRFHMKTDWHRYNLKRRVADLTPISAEVFTEKLELLSKEAKYDEFGFKIEDNHRSKQQGSASTTYSRNFTHFRKSLRHIKSNDTEFSNFSLGDSIHSSYHTDTESNFETNSELSYDSYDEDNESDIEGEDNYEYELESDDEISNLNCLFCGKPSDTVEANSQHMYKSHGLYIPNQRYLVDLDGLINYLIDNIVINLNCLNCNFHGKNLESIRAHLKSKAHYRLPYETREERELLAEFYKFKTSMKKSVGFASEPDADQNMEDDGDNHDDSDDGEYTIAQINPNLELSLPNGSLLGHRLNNRIYQQSIVVKTPKESQVTVQSADKRLSCPVKNPPTHTTVHEKQPNLNKKINYQKHFRDQMI